MRDAADWFSVVAPAAANGTQRARKKSAKPTGTIHSNFIKTYPPNLYETPPPQTFIGKAYVSTLFKPIEKLF
jgi:hypothetical protein